MTEDQNIQEPAAEAQDSKPFRSPIVAGTSPMAIVPTTIDDCQRLARLIFASRLAPYQLKSAEAVCAVILKGLELGLPPMAALAGMTVIGGRPAAYGDLVMAQIRRSRQLESWKEWFDGNPFDDNFTALCTMKRFGQDAVTNEYSVLDAKTALLWGKRGRDGEPSAWITNPKRMLRFRARHFTSRDVFQDILLGLDIAEELQDAIDVGSMPVRDEAPEAPRAMSRAESREASKGAIDGSSPPSPPPADEKDDVDWPAFDLAFQRAMQISRTVHDVECVFASISDDLDVMPAEMSTRLRSVYRSRLAAVTPAKTEASATENPTWGERLAGFRETIANEGHDTEIRRLLGEIKALNPPAKIGRDFEKAAEERIRELDGDRGPALAKEPTPDEQHAAGPPTPPTETVEHDDDFWARHEKGYRSEIAGARNLAELNAMTAKYALSDMPVALGMRMENASATIAEKLRGEAKPPVTEGKATFANNDEMETACDEVALKMRRSRTLAELDNVERDLREFLSSHVVDRENTEKLESVLKQRRRLLEKKAAEQ